jgi:hypothetical protein
MHDGHFNPHEYGSQVASLLAELRLPPLGPGELHPSARSALKEFDPLNDLGKPVTDPDAARACYSGLWLFHDGLDESHTISQDLDTPEGSAWHAIMHRREPDASNSKYWWRRVGEHAVFELLKERTPALGYFFTTPYDFVDLCERVRGQNDAQEALAKRVQLLEWQLLFDACYRKATA